MGDDDFHPRVAAPNRFSVEIGVPAQDPRPVPVEIRPAKPENVRAVGVAFFIGRPERLSVREMDMNFVFGNVRGDEALGNVGPEQDATPAGKAGVYVAERRQNRPALRGKRSAVDPEGFLRLEIDNDQVVPSFALLARLEGAEETDQLRRAGAAVPTQRVSPAPGADLNRPATGLGYKVIESQSLTRKGRADPDAAATEAVRNADRGRQGLGKWMRRRGRRHRRRCRNWRRGAFAANRRPSTPPPQAGSIRTAAMTVAAKPRGCVSQGRFIAACASFL